MRKKRFRSWLLVSWLTTCTPLFVPGCGSDGEQSEGEGSFEIDDGAGAGIATSAIASPDKETTLSLKTGAMVVVPAGAVDGNVELGLKRASDAEAKEFVATVPNTDKVTSAPYVLTPHGTKFKKDVEVTLPINKAANPEKLAVLWLEDEKDTTWEILGKAKARDEKTATIQVQHFSVLLLVETERTVGGTVVPNDELDASVPSATRDGSVGPGPGSSDDDAGDSEADGGVIRDFDGGPDAEAPDCFSDCASALAAAGVSCGQVSNGCGETLYCTDTCPTGDYCDEEARECKPSACGTTCAAMEPWQSYCNHTGLGSSCFPSSPAWKCDEQAGECTEWGACMQCDGKCIDGYGCDPDTVRLFDGEGGSFEDDYLGGMTVPAGAVSAPTEFRLVHEPEWPDFWPPDFPYPYNGNSAGERCVGPYAVSFSEPITLTLRFYGLPQAAVPAVFRLDDPSDTTWTAANGATITELGEGKYLVTLQTTTLGCFGVGQDI